MRPPAALALGMILWPAIALGDAPKITGPTTVPVYRMVRLKIEGDAESAVWFVEPAELVDVEDGADGLSIEFTGPPGKYTLLAVTIKGSKLGKARAVVTIGDAPGPTPPTPPPTPGPNPPPVPPPTPPLPTPQGTLHVTLVFDELTQTIAQANLREGLKVSPALKGLDADYHTIAWGTADPPQRSFLAAVAKYRADRNLAALRPPYLLITDARGAVQPGPDAVKAEDDVIAAVKAIRGVKP